MRRVVIGIAYPLVIGNWVLILIRSMPVKLLLIELR